MTQNAISPCLLLHGGAGAFERLEWVGEDKYREGLRAALEVGEKVLLTKEEDGKDSRALSACIAAVRSMEENGVFNAGRGACLNAEGEAELDAAVMDGRDLGVGAFGGASAVEDPIGLAEAILKKTQHAILVGEGANRFAQEIGMSTVETSKERKDEWLRRRERMQSKEKEVSLTSMSSATGQRNGHDTVGAVAIDYLGNVASAVSTGGLWHKRVGRVGDSPLPGSGFWAQNGCGVACTTGTGEFILRTLLARRAIEIIERDGFDSTKACQHALDFLETRFGSDTAGIICIDNQGRPGLAFNTSGMGSALSYKGERSVAIFPGESPLQQQQQQQQRTAATANSS